MYRKIFCFWKWMHKLQFYLIFNHSISFKARHSCCWQCFNKNFAWSWYGWKAERIIELPTRSVCSARHRGQTNDWKDWKILNEDVWICWKFGLFNTKNWHFDWPYESFPVFWNERFLWILDLLRHIGLHSNIKYFKWRGSKT